MIKTINNYDGMLQDRQHFCPGKQGVFRLAIILFYSVICVLIVLLYNMSFRIQKTMTIYGHSHTVMVHNCPSLH